MSKFFLTIGANTEAQIDAVQEKLPEVFSNVSKPAAKIESATDKIASDGWPVLRTLEIEAPQTSVPLGGVLWAFTRAHKVDATCTADLGRTVSSGAPAFYMLLNAS